MSTITSLDGAVDSPSTAVGIINTNFSNLNTDKIEATQTVALTNKTIDGDLNTVQDLPYSAIKSTSRTGLDTKIVTGTAGSTSEVAMWNVDGDVVTSGVTITTTAPTTASLDTTIPTSQAVQEAITAQMLTKSLFIPVTGGNTITSAYDTAVGDFVTNTPDAAQVFYFTFRVPSNFTSLTSANMAMIPDATESVQFDIEVDFGQVGELYTTNTVTTSNQSASVTVSVIAESDIASSLTGITAGDYVGIKITSDTTQLRVLGLNLIYT